MCGEAIQRERFEKIQFTPNARRFPNKKDGGKQEEEALNYYFRAGVETTKGRSRVGVFIIVYEVVPFLQEPTSSPIIKALFYVSLLIPTLLFFLDYGPGKVEFRWRRGVSGKKNDVYHSMRVVCNSEIIVLSPSLVIFIMLSHISIENVPNIICKMLNIEVFFYFNPLHIIS